MCPFDSDYEEDPWLDYGAPWLDDEVVPNSEETFFDEMDEDQTESDGFSKILRKLVPDKFKKVKNEFQPNDNADRMRDMRNADAFEREGPESFKENELDLEDTYPRKETGIFFLKKG
jgi:hypothetical protein